MTFDLQRFVDAQDPIYARVLEELRAGRKQTHWMWFVFPQIAGLGFSETAKLYGIASLDEAIAYLKHPVLGSRLIECANLVLKVRDRSIHQILGSPDDMKFRSCMTLFARAAEDPAVFKEALKKYFGGHEDPLTVERIAP